MHNELSAIDKRTIKELESDFDEAMMDVYRRALNECDYKASRFLHMLHEHRGLETARILLHAPGVSEGYSALWERKRLDLTVEAVIIDRKWETLFTNAERNIARTRLAAYGYELPAPIERSKEAE